MSNPIHQYIPPIVKRQLTGLFYGWSGNYKTWEEASAKCTGYHTDEIINRVKNAVLKVKNGEAAFERDSVLFNKIVYSFPLLSALSVAAIDCKQLNVLDFGGSLGSSYFQNRNFYINKLPFSWNVVEQEHFVKAGKHDFEDDYLKFYYTIEDCLKEKQIDVLVLSSVLQYLPNPFDFIEYFLKFNFKYIVIDRAPVLLYGENRICIQKVPKAIYNAQYPCWLLNNDELKNIFLKNYTLLFEEETQESININNAAFKAFFFRKEN
ncbi:MAG: methyltransferase, TIGR04325 family [Bacteroidia bacterium]|nr:methyltransferase, TIGR04325 family [Bacteroidia bacterium]